MIGRSLRPREVSRYSTVGGLEGITVRSTSPAASRSRSRSESIRGEMPATAAANSLKRSAPVISAYRIESCQRRSRRSAVWRTSSGTGSHLGDLRDIAGGLQCAVEDLLDGHHRMEGHLLADLLGNVVQVAAVALGQDHVGQACCMSGERLLLEPADRRNAALQRDLTGHP